MLRRRQRPNDLATKLENEQLSIFKPMNTNSRKEYLTVVFNRVPPVVVPRDDDDDDVGSLTTFYARSKSE